MTLVTEGPNHWHEGVTFDVIWYGDIEDVNINEDNGRTVEFQGAHVVLLDTFNKRRYVIGTIPRHTSNAVLFS
jgi:hypothetical protein